MTQLEIQFFWPLTEQIPLDLEYPNTEIKSTPIVTGINSNVYNLTYGDTNINRAIVFDTDEITIRQRNKPNIIKRALYRMLGIQWQMK
jgi:hypothetical protein